MGYKLLTQDMKTRKGCHNEMDWSDIGQWHEATGKRGQGLCSDEYLHDYDDLLLAVFMNPVHANIKNPICYETERDGDTETDGLKRGSRRLRLVREVKLPDVTDEQWVRFAILCAMEVYREPSWIEWADNWLSGKDRSPDAAAAVASDTFDRDFTSYFAAYTVAYGGADDGAPDAAHAAADAAANTNIMIDFVAIAHKAVSA